MPDTPPTPAARRRGFRCWIGLHRWVNRYDGRRDEWQCKRCRRFPKPCSNCGMTHDPTAIVICTVRRTYR